jgi:hypothetical protein
MNDEYKKIRYKKRRNVPAKILRKELQNVKRILKTPRNCGIF